MLPHRFPFQFVSLSAESMQRSAADALDAERDRSPEKGRLKVLLSHGTGPLRGMVHLPSILGIEIVAQATAALLSSSSEDRPSEVFLAGAEVQFSDSLGERPMSAGDELEVQVETRCDFGKLRKVSGRIEREGEVLLEADLMLTV